MTATTLIHAIAHTPPPLGWHVDRDPHSGALEVWQPRGPRFYATPGWEGADGIVVAIETITAGVVDEVESFEVGVRWPASLRQRVRAYWRALGPLIGMPLYHLRSLR